MTLVGNNPGSGIGMWELLAGIGTIVDLNNLATEVTGLGGGANTFSWTINNDGCIASDYVTITYYVLPVADFIPNHLSGCPPLTVNFVNNSIGGFPYLWDFGDGNSSSDPNTQHTYNYSGTYKARLTATGPDGIYVNKDTAIIVHELPVANFDVTTTKVYIPEQPVHCFNLSDNYDSCLWEFGDSAASTEVNASYYYTEEGIYDITLYVWSEHGCFDSLTMNDVVEVEKSGKIIFPNAFSPNLSGPTSCYCLEHDYSNDVFCPLIKGVVEYHMEIYNRWGILLFESSELNIGWDGYNKGKLSDEGVYVWRIIGRYNNGKSFEFLGNVIILH
ncbi:hypothetical protein ES708_24622 [subsurface metagenome]